MHEVRKKKRYGHIYMYINIHLNIYMKIMATASTEYAQILLREPLMDGTCYIWGGYDY